MLGALEGPIILATPVAANDTLVLSQATRGLYVGVSGNINVRFATAVANTNYPSSNNNYKVSTIFYNVQAGATLPIRVDMVYATGTTANSILSLV